MTIDNNYFIITRTCEHFHFRFYSFNFHFFFHFISPKIMCCCSIRFFLTLLIWKKWSNFFLVFIFHFFHWSWCSIFPENKISFVLNLIHYEDEDYYWIWCSSRDFFFDILIWISFVHILNNFVSINHQSIFGNRKTFSPFLSFLSPDLKDLIWPSVISRKNMNKSVCLFSHRFVNCFVPTVCLFFLFIKLPNLECVTHHITLNVFCHIRLSMP